MNSKNIFFTYYLLASLASCAHYQMENLPTPPSSLKIKNLILLIGDGMGPQQIALGQLYAEHGKSAVVKQTAMMKLMQSGTTALIQQKPAHSLVIDSACSATQMATGKEALSEVIGLGPEGIVAETILEKAIKAGKSAGLVSDTRLTHATPAAFAAHTSHRSQENDIAEQMIKSKAQVLFSGGYQYFFPKSVNDKNSLSFSLAHKKLPSSLTPKSKREDEQDLIQRAQDSGYSLAFDRKQLQNLKGDRALGLFTPSSMPDGIEHSETKNLSSRTIPTLAEMTAKALEILSKNPQGFFLMMEGGQIDWAGHSNDAGLLLHEMLKFDEGIQVVLDWAKNRDDTLIILTADHETGSFGISYSAYNLPSPQKKKDPSFATRDYWPLFNFGPYQSLDLLYQQKKSLKKIFEEYQRQPEKKQTVANFQELIKENTAIHITEEEGNEALASSSNPYHHEGHPYLKEKTWAKITDFNAFYPYDEDRRSAAIGRQLARYQQVVWGSGTHTTTLIPVFTWGPKNWQELFTNPKTGAGLGALMIKSFLPEK